MLLGVGGFLVVAVPAAHVSDVVGRFAALSGGTAALLFAAPLPRGHDRWRVAGVVLLLAPALVAAVVLGPVGVLAPEWVADPDGRGRLWPRTPDRAMTTGWVVTGALVVLAAAYGWARVADRRHGRRR